MVKDQHRCERARSRWLALALSGIVVMSVPVDGSAAAPQSSEGGGELLDGGTFIAGPPEHIDPALNSTLDAYQVINAMYDGLTDIDVSDPENARIVPLLAETFEPNEDATVWTFTIKDGLTFADGEEILPSTFQRSWERAADIAGDYSYLFNFIEGGAERLAGEADTISGVVADDEAMTLTVTLSAPYSNFDAVAGFQLFFPVPEAADAAGDGYQEELMVGNGPYTLESPRSDDEIVLVRNDRWAGDFNGDTWPGRAERIVFRVFADVDTSYNALEAGEVDNATIPPARSEEARSNWGTTLDTALLASYHYLFNQRDPRIGGPDNLPLRQAISMAVDRDAINEAVYNGMRTVSTGITPPGIPGFAENLCDYCAYDPEGAQAAYDEWLAAGNEPETIPIQFNADAGHEPVVAIIVDNLAAIGIEAEADPRITETYFTELADGACVFCRIGWTADYPTYDNFMYDQYHSESLDGNNYGFINEEFDALIDEAKATTDPDARAQLFNQAEDILLNQDVGVVPINWYLGDYAFNPEVLQGFGQNPLALINWEQITITR
jgi:ABC-type oligopeptide transport system substrate-binding subunit